MRPKFSQILQFAGFDAHIILTLLFRGWSVIAGAVMIVLIPVWLGQVEQGYYYTFASLLGLQIFFELGMNQVILQFVSHEFAHLQRNDGNRLIGDRTKIGKLASLIGLLHRWYLTAAITFFVVVSTGGCVFFSQREFGTAQWIGPWIIVTFATAINLYCSAELTVLEGCGEVGNVARMRLAQSVIGYLLMWLALFLGSGLWAVTLVPLVAAAMTVIWLRRNMHPILHLPGSTYPNDVSISWRRDIFPFQWRISLSWMSGYFIFQLFIPLAFAKQGAVNAGRLGITMAIFNAVLSVGMSWVYAKVPTMAAYVSRNERRSLNKLFFTVVSRSMIFTAVISAAVIVTLMLLNKFVPEFASRFSPVSVAICVAIVTIANNFVFAAAAYMRAHKEEPMLWVSIATGMATALAALNGSSIGILPMMIAYTLITIFVSLPWTTWLFVTYVRRKE